MMNNEMNDQVECQYPSNSHDSLLQSDLHHFNSTTIVDDLTRTNQQLSSTFHSKDSALGLSDENLNHNSLTHLEHDEQIPSCSLLEDKSKFHLINNLKTCPKFTFFSIYHQNQRLNRVLDECVADIPSHAYTSNFNYP